jgi:hypothetical protein
MVTFNLPLWSNLPSGLYLPTVASQKVNGCPLLSGGTRSSSLRRKTREGDAAALQEGIAAAIGPPISPVGASGVAGVRAIECSPLVLAAVGRHLERTESRRPGRASVVEYIDVLRVTRAASIAERGDAKCITYSSEVNSCGDF